MLPEMDGFALCREIRKESDIPIVMLTARGDVMDRVVGLELGADDYLPKPFEPRELVARVQTILRRQRAAPAAAPTAAPASSTAWRSTSTSARCSARASAVELTGTEFELLALLAREPGKVFSRDDILNRLRGHEAELYTRAVDIVVSRLRRKLEPLDCIKTLRNAGYTLAVGQRRAVRRAPRRRARRRWHHRWRHSLRAAPGHGVRAAGAGDDRGVPGRHAARLLQRLARRGAAAGRRLRGPARRRDRHAARRGARPGAGRRGCRSRSASRARRCNWDSHPDRAQAARLRPRAAATGSRRTTADGHRISFGLGTLPWQREPQRHRLDHAGAAAGADRAGLRLRAAPAAAARRHPRRRRSASAAARFDAADPAAPPRRAGRPGAAHQHHGARHPGHARRQARAAAGAEPRAALAADPRAPQRRAAARHARRRDRARRAAARPGARCAT